MYKRQGHGGTGKSDDDHWENLVASSGLLARIVKAEKKETQRIIRYTNSQNAVKGKDFLALEDIFKNWAKEMEENFKVFLEIRPGDWPRKRILQKGKPNLIRYHAQAFDLLKIYGAGWLGLPGSAWANNKLFEPDGELYAKIISSPDFGCDDLFAAFVLKRLADTEGFGKRKVESSRRLTRFLFYFVFVSLLRNSIRNHTKDLPDYRTITKSILYLNESENIESLTNISCNAIDEYMNSEINERSIYSESEFDSDPNKFLKDKRFGDVSDLDYNRELFNLINFMSQVYTASRPGDSELIEVLKEGSVI